MNFIVSSTIELQRLAQHHECAKNAMYQRWLVHIAFFKDWKNGLPGDTQQDDVLAVHASSDRSLQQASWACSTRPNANIFGTDAGKLYCNDQRPSPWPRNHSR